MGEGARLFLRPLSPALLWENPGEPESRPVLRTYKLTFNDCSVEFKNSKSEPAGLPLIHLCKERSAFRAGMYMRFMIVVELLIMGFLFRRLIHYF